MNVVIKLEIAISNPFILEELIDNDIFISLIIRGNEEYATNNDDIIDFSYDRWFIDCLLNENIKTDEEINFYKQKIESICQDLDFKIITAKIFIDNTIYPLNGEDNNSFIETNKFCIINDINFFNTSKANNKYPLYVNSGQGFGTGRHETTALCIALLEELSEETFSDFIPKKILDLGTGSGILAMISAILYQDSQILAVDIDPLSLQTAQNFLKINKLDNKITLQESNGFNEIKDSDYNLIIANILLNPLLNMAVDFSSHMVEGSYLVVSGFYAQQFLPLQTALQNNNFTFIKVQEKNNWLAALFCKQ